MDDSYAGVVVGTGAQTAQGWDVCQRQLREGQAQLLDKHGVEAGDLAASRLSGWALSLLARVDVVVEQRKPLYVARVDLEGRNWLQPEALSGRLQGIANGVPRAQDLVILDECVPPGMALLQQ